MEVELKTEFSKEDTEDFYASFERLYETTQNKIILYMKLLKHSSSAECRHKRTNTTFKTINR